MPVFLPEIAEKFLCNVVLHLSILFAEVAEEFEHLLSLQCKVGFANFFAELEENICAFTYYVIHMCRLKFA